MPTGGVEATQESVTAWFKAGVAVVGIGGNLIRKDLIEANNYDEISSRVAQVLGWIREARKK
jgi:2-dehydro-3-deoxyphosphogluconate aldolase/(4S)-4-hydroxy-2-oxoglutarate aldolase